MRKILDSVMVHSKSVNEISRETPIANTTTYRKIKPEQIDSDKKWITTT
jgi:hypothetical protein